MKTRKVLLFSSDEEIISFIKISALTLTKLNCQIDIDVTSDYIYGEEKCQKQNVDLIIADLDSEYLNVLNFIINLRKNKNSNSKKIISVHSQEINRNDVYSSGCDSIMTKDELKKHINNVLQF